MYDLTALRNWLVNEIYQHTEVPLVPQNSADPRPPKPFSTYNFISPYIPQAAQPALIRHDKVVEDENWVEYKRWELPTITISLNSYASGISDCWQKAMELKEWFAMKGYRSLKDEGIIVASIEGMEDRTLLLDETNYEYRVGFDVVLRVVSETSRLVETIEKVEVNENTYEE